MATHTDHSFASSLQTYITFEGRARPAPLAVWPFGAPVLLLRCRHGLFCCAFTYPLIPSKTHTHTHAPTRNRLRPTIFGRASKFSRHYWPECPPITQFKRKDWCKGRGEVCAVPPLHNDYWLIQSQSVCNATGLVTTRYVRSPDPGELYSSE